MRFIMRPPGGALHHTASRWIRFKTITVNRTGCTVKLQYIGCDCLCEYQKTKKKIISIIKSPASFSTTFFLAQLTRMRPPRLHVCFELLLEANKCFMRQRQTVKVAVWWQNVYFKRILHAKCVYLMRILHTFHAQNMHLQGFWAHRPPVAPIWRAESHVFLLAAEHQHFLSVLPTTV